MNESTLSLLVSYDGGIFYGLHAKGTLEELLIEAQKLSKKGLRWTIVDEQDEIVAQTPRYEARAIELAGIKKNATSGGKSECIGRWLDRIYCLKHRRGARRRR